MTPVEGTCCQALGGPDADGDDRCEDTGTSFEVPAWTALGFRPGPEHAFVYATEVEVRDGVPWFAARAYGDLDCDAVQSTFARFARGATPGGGCGAEVVPGFHSQWENE